MHCWLIARIVDALDTILAVSLTRFMDRRRGQRVSKSNEIGHRNNERLLVEFHKSRIQKKEA